MESSRANLCWKWMTLVGIFLIFTVTCFGLYYGNLYIYIISSVLRHQAPSAYVLSPWTDSIYIVANNVVFMLAGFALESTNKKAFLFVGILISDSGLLTAIFTISMSMTALNFSLGLLNGIGSGIICCVGMHLIVEWTDDDVGTLLAVVQSGFHIGAIFWNQLVTMYINPDQEKPDVAVESFMFFSQDSVVDNVPSAFLILGLARLVISFVGFLMVSEPKTGHKNDVSSSTTYNSTGLIQERGRPDTTVEDGIASLEERTSDVGREGSVCLPECDAMFRLERKEKDKNLWELLKTKEYNLLLFSFLACDTFVFIINNYYKVYGQLYIKDDYFLTLIGTLTGVIVIASTVVWGYMMDIFGVKKSLIVLLLITSIILPFYFFTPMQSRWLFMAFTLTNFASSSLYPIYSGYVVKCFGKSHFPKIFGSLVVASCVLMLGIPTAAEQIIVHIGWFALFCFPALLCAIGLMLVVVFFSNKI